MLWIQRQRSVLEWAASLYSTCLQLKAAVSFSGIVYFSGIACLLPAAAEQSWEKIYLVLEIADRWYIGASACSKSPFCLSV